MKYYLERKINSHTLKSIHNDVLISAKNVTILPATERFIFYDLDEKIFASSLQIAFFFSVYHRVNFNNNKTMKIYHWLNKHKGTFEGNTYSIINKGNAYSKLKFNNEFVGELFGIEEGYMTYKMELDCIEKDCTIFFSIIAIASFNFDTA